MAARAPPLPPELPLGCDRRPPPPIGMLLPPLLAAVAEAASGGLPQLEYARRGGLRQRRLRLCTSTAAQFNQLTRNRARGLGRPAALGTRACTSPDMRRLGPTSGGPDRSIRAVNTDVTRFSFYRCEKKSMCCFRLGLSVVLPLPQVLAHCDISSSVSNEFRNHLSQTFSFRSYAGIYTKHSFEMVVMPLTFRCWQIFRSKNFPFKQFLARR